MAKLTHRIRRAQASAIAIAIILAMLVAPLCGSSCAGLSGCGVTVGIASSGGEDCHHADSSTSETGHLLKTRPCSQQEQPTAIVSVPEKPSSLSEVPSPLPFYARKQIVPVGLDFYRHRTLWREPGDPPQAALLEITATILQI
jgi:hypothetical protein